MAVYKEIYTNVYIYLQLYKEQATGSKLNKYKQFYQKIHEHKPKKKFINQHKHENVLLLVLWSYTLYKKHIKVLKKDIKNIHYQEMNLNGLNYDNHCT